MKIINLEQIKKAKLNQHPYTYGKIPSVFYEGKYQQLCVEYPTEDFVHCQTLNQEKTYSMYMKQLFNNSYDVPLNSQDLSDNWQNMLKDLLSENYIKTLSQHVKQDLRKCRIEINCWQYLNGCWLSPHTDKIEKVVSQLFYFNENWDPKWGGAIRVLNSDDNEDFYEEILPHIDTSIILVRSEHSWHSVAPLTCPDNISRKLMQIIFWKQ